MLLVLKESPLYYKTSLSQKSVNTGQCRRCYSLVRQSPSPAFRDKNAEVIGDDWNLALRRGRLRTSTEWRLYVQADSRIWPAYRAQIGANGL